MKDNTLPEIYKKVEQEIKKYEKKLTKQKVNTTKPQYHLWSHKDLEIAGSKRDKVYFAWVIQQKHFVGFYFMPVYADSEKMRKVFSKELLSMLQGKSCFHLKKMDDQLLKDIRYALSEGYKEYQQKGWV